MHEYSRAALREFLEILLLSLAIIIPVRYFLIQPFIVRGASMEPNFFNGDYLVIDEISYRFQEPKRGDVVVFRFPRNPRQYFIKRIAALPGETVEIKHGKIFVTSPDGGKFILDEDAYLAPSITTAPDNKWHIEEGSYFVLGDNRTGSYDSRSWGMVPRKFIVGRVLLRAFPIGRIGLFPSHAAPQLYSP